MPMQVCSPECVAVHLTESSMADIKADTDAPVAILTELELSHAIHFRYLHDPRRAIHCQAILERKDNQC
jgi:hypothetical protein